MLLVDYQDDHNKQKEIRHYGVYLYRVFVNQ